MNLAVIGLGKLGLPLAALLANSTNDVFAYDSSEAVRVNLRNQKTTFTEPGLDELLQDSSSSLHICNSIVETVSQADIVFIIVPTPSEESGRFTNRFVLDAVNEIGRAIRGHGKKIVIDIVSTVMPGSCEGEITSALENSSNRKIGENLGLCYNPEFIALGSVIHDMEYPDMHLIGQSSDWAGQMVEAALKTIVKREVPVRRMSLTEAELVKIAVNNFVTMKISYANLLYQAALTLGNVNIDTITNAIGLDSRVGMKYLKAAAPYGGPCFPRDTRALSYMYQEIGLSDSLSSATNVANLNHIEFIGNYVKGRIAGTDKVGIVGISYKPGTKVTEESPGVAIGKKIEKLGHEVVYWDDEAAVVEPEQNSWTRKLTLEEFLLDADFILVARPIKDISKLYGLLEISGKPFLDLWRQKNQVPNIT